MARILGLRSLFFFGFRRTCSYVRGLRRLKRSSPTSGLVVGQCGGRGGAGGNAATRYAGDDSRAREKRYDAVPPGIWRF